RISPSGWSLLPGAPPLTRTGLPPARTTRLSGRTIGPILSHGEPIMTCMTIPRRAFLATAAAPAFIRAAPQPQTGANRTVFLTGDGVSLSPREYAALLTSITSSDQFRRDNYLASGPVEELEKRFASYFGKEAAIFLPTGTLANHMAVRLLAG